MERTCAVCDKAAKSRCGRCKTTAYCSKECQNKDWREHKQRCVKSESTFDNPSHTYSNPTAPGESMLFSEEKIEERLSTMKATCDWWQVLHNGTAKALPGCTETKAGKIVKGRKVKKQHFLLLPKSSTFVSCDIFSGNGEDAGPYEWPNMDLLMFSDGKCSYESDVVLHFKDCDTSDMTDDLLDS